MSGVSTPRHEPIPIGEVAEPPFAHLPDPSTLFETRAARFRVLAEGHQLAPYLNFLAALSAAQHEVLGGLPAPEMPAADALALARQHGMPPLDRGKFTADPAFDETLEGLFGRATAIAMPEPAREALRRASGADAGERAAMVRAVLDDAIPVERLADHLFVAAALQVHFARLSARLDAKSLKEIGDGVCPACGGAPVASLVVGRAGAHNSRYCVCSLCATQWNYVRIKCAVCGSTKGISYQHVEHDKQVRAETCDTCHSYVKIMQQIQNPALDPVADDVASLALDLMVRELGYRRGAVNPFMLGY
ncbi:MAG: formate dehydrogenase accessory protein FdhE [Proteobacteria bacterium]|nr:formate dehydrogenase accessory protein FdhE [Pseudomonadota bacterium]